MKRPICLLVLILFLSPLWAHSIFAISLGFNPVSQTVGVGDMLDVDVVISGLDAAGEIVSSFDLDVEYDANILTATNVTFGNFLGGPLWSLQDPILTPGLVDFAETSFLSDIELDALQSDSFTLATLTFDAIALGTSSLTFIWDQFNDIKGSTADDSTADDPKVNILQLDSVDGSVSVVPEPATILLVGSGLLGLAGVIKRRKRKVIKQ